MIIKCPGCEMILEAAADAAGNSLQCTYCELTFVLEKQHHNSPALKKKKISIHRAVRKNSKIAQRKKVAKKSGVNKYLLIFGIVLTLAFLVVATVGLSQHDSTPEEKRISKSSRAVVSKPSNSLFKFDEWSKKYGQSVDVNEWMSNNPHPYGQRWDPKRSYFHSLYTTTLGPLGIRTRMHEQSWARLFQLQEKGFPKVLMDVYGPLMNALEVVHVHEKGPADTHVQKGDLILEIEGQALKSSLWVNLENKYKATERRGLEIHAGQMIDLAEGRGKIKLKVLRLPKTYKIKKIAPRAEKHIQTLETKALDTIQVKMNLPESQYLSIKAKTGNYRFLELAIVNQQGAKIYLNHLDRGTVFKNSNWSKNYINTKTGSWVAKGPFHFHIVMPPGKWQLRGEIKSESKKSEAIEFGYIKKAKLSAELKTYCKTVEFKIPRIGSFGKSFDPKSDKLRNYTATLAKRLSIQQAPDGSWRYLASFTSPSFYTSMCGLGLLAEDNPAYKKHIRKAAHYVAYSGQKSNWSWTHGINTMFLAEYYLRTKDKSILDGLSVALLACEKSLFVDYVAGHHASSPGYGGFGQISGSGAVACALAIAEHTPAKFTRGTALNMMATIQSLSPRGVIPYGRRTLGSLTKQAFKHEGFLKGQSAFAGTGLYYAAGKISGGSSFFNDVVTRRLETAPYGDLDGGHATHTLHFVFGIIAASISSPKAYKANLEAFLWKLTTHRGFDGLIVNNSNPMEHHSGEKVMGKPWWSTGGYLIMLNAHKRNLAMTGKEKYMASSQKELPLIHNA
ncbi:MAG: hypothetical protein HRT88_14180, partial [Lentisphaeraceae bacterium]|nr:hypothetical protein [Lentisphaeraceae bacterium]